jgi:glutamate dehydrogenase
VTDAIIYDNFLQAQILSQEAARSATLLEAYEQGMQLLESQDMLDRDIEFLPSGEQLSERIKAGRGMTKPELSVLLAYGKRSLYAALLDSELIDHEYFAQDLAGYFPAPVVDRFGHLINEHPLRRELIATIVANQVMNSEGITFVSRLMDQTGADPALVVKAYRIARAITGAEERWRELEAVVGAIDADVLRRLMDNVDWLVETTARWFLNNPAGQQPIDATIEQFATDYKTLAESIGSSGPAAWQQTRHDSTAQLRSCGVPEKIAKHHAHIEDLVHGPDIIELAQQTGRSVGEVSGVFFRLGKSVRIDWLEDEAAKLEPIDRWERLAKQAAAGDLIVLRRRLAERVLARAGSRAPRDAVRKYLAERSEAHGRLLLFMRELAKQGVDSVDAVIVATRTIERNLI